MKKKRTEQCHRCDNPLEHCFSAKACGRSFVLALIALAVGVVCIMGGYWHPGLILMFAAVAGVMTAWQMRRQMTMRPNPEAE